MEDAHIAEPNLDPEVSLFAVFDGHGGIFFHFNKNKDSNFFDLKVNDINNLLLNRKRSCNICSEAFLPRIKKEPEFYWKEFRQSITRNLFKNGWTPKDRRRPKRAKAIKEW